VTHFASPVTGGDVAFGRRMPLESVISLWQSNEYTVILQIIKKKRFSQYMVYFADLAGSSVYSLARRRNWSVCSGRVDTDLTQLTRS